MLNNNNSVSLAKKVFFISFHNDRTGAQRVCFLLRTTQFESYIDKIQRSSDSTNYDLLTTVCHGT